MKNNLQAVIDASLEQIVAEKFIRYSKYVIQNRAIPDVRDGLKPVQRRILYSMWNLGLKKDKPYKKSARVVGDVIGKYHPHGDSSIYDALVRMSQEWKMNVPLVDMHGNKGSIDDDPAAAMRYTETRLEEISNDLLELISKNVVSWTPNFDDSEKEPTVLPTIFPNLLVNGAIGIASGFATDIPPHNLGEVIDGCIAMLNNKNISIAELGAIIQGPDFPTGGIIYGKEGIKDAFATGKGRLTLTAKYEIIEDKNQRLIQISQIPFGIAKANLIRQIDDIKFEQKVYGIKEVVDQSDRNGILINVELEADANIDLIINYLLQKTDLQIYYSYNSIAICDNSPKLLSIKQLVGYYLDHLEKIKFAELEFDFAKNEKKLEITKGFLRVADITDEVIKVIRASDNSKAGVIADLIKYFQFSPLQAEAIAQMRLYRLSKIDQQMFLKDKEELENTLKKLQLLINDKEEFKKYLIELLLSVKSKHQRPRLTQIIDKNLNVKINYDQLVKEEFFFFSISKNGFYKKMSIKTNIIEEVSKLPVAEKDFLISLDMVSSRDKIFLITNLGNLITLLPHALEESQLKQSGIDLKTKLAFGHKEYIIAAIPVSNIDNQSLILVSLAGLAKRVSLDNFANYKHNKITNIFKLKDSDELISCHLGENNANIAIFTSLNRGLKVSETDVPIYGKNSAGVRLINLRTNESISGTALIFEDEKVLIFDHWSRFDQLLPGNILFGQRGSAPKKIETNLDFSKPIMSVSAFNSNFGIFDFSDLIKIYNINEATSLKASSKKCYKILRLPVKPELKNEVKFEPKVETKSKTINKTKEKLESKVQKSTKSENEQTKVFNFDEALQRAKTKLQQVNELDIDALLKKFEEDE